MSSSRVRFQFPEVPGYFPNIDVDARLGCRPMFEGGPRNTDARHPIPPSVRTWFPIMISHRQDFGGKTPGDPVWLATRHLRRDHIQSSGIFSDPDPDIHETIIRLSVVLKIPYSSRCYGETYQF